MPPASVSSQYTRSAWRNGSARRWHGHAMIRDGPRGGTRSAPGGDDQRPPRLANRAASGRDAPVHRPPQRMPGLGLAQRERRVGVARRAERRLAVGARGAGAVDEGQVLVRRWRGPWRCVRPACSAVLELLARPRRTARRRRRGCRSAARARPAARITSVRPAGARCGAAGRRRARPSAAAAVCGQVKASSSIRTWRSVTGLSALTCDGGACRAGSLRCAR